MIAPILLYLVLILAYVAIRPPLSYNEDGSLKPFGFGNGKTVFPLWVIALIMAVLVSFLYSYITV